MTTIFREAEPDDAPIIGALVAALDAHYIGEALAPDPTAAAAMARRALETREGSRVILAEVDGVPAGLAIFGVLRPGRALTGVVFLKELFVLERFRRHGVGRALIGQVARWARDRGIGRIDLTTDATNIEAVRFYERHGGKEQKKRFFRFAGDDLARLAEGGD